MRPNALGYIGVGSSDLNDWENFGIGLVGLQCGDSSSQFRAFRMDDRKSRLLIDGTHPDGDCFFGWEVSNADELDRFGAKLDAADVAVTREPAHVAEMRAVAQVLSFNDPAGNRVEIFSGPETADTAFVPGRDISGFRTGKLGMGHAVLTVERVEEVLPFYTEVLGFSISDFMTAPFKAHFLHINGRHHSLALIETGKRGVHHLMVELFSLDDVGQGYDLANDQDRVNVTLGRHTNDFMTSFYLKTPSPFLLEYGWGGREIDPASWQARECPEGPSLWGHERKWLSEADRATARKMRMDAAARGVRHPVQVLDGNYQPMSGKCPWRAE